MYEIKNGKPMCPWTADVTRGNKRMLFSWLALQRSAAGTRSMSLGFTAEIYGAVLNYYHKSIALIFPCCCQTGRGEGGGGVSANRWLPQTKQVPLSPGAEQSRAEAGPEPAESS